jgi:hypothetical protein
MDKMAVREGKQKLLKIILYLASVYNYVSFNVATVKVTL